MANAAKKFGVNRFVLISTDKAVEPENIMGVSKRLAELYCREANRNGRTKFITVRFGNVLGSNGSVVTLFQKQIARGGPVTVTDPEMTRYFMTIPEAITLIPQASTMGEGGEIFVLDMGEPVKVVDMARHLISLSGYDPDHDIPIEFTGVRPGEKLYERLWYHTKKSQRTDFEKIMVARTNGHTDLLLLKQLREILDRLVPFLALSFRGVLRAFASQPSLCENSLVKNILPLYLFSNHYTEDGPTNEKLVWRI